MVTFPFFPLACAVVTACAVLLCGSLVRDKMGDEPHRGGDGEI